MSWALLLAAAFTLPGCEGAIMDSERPQFDGGEPPDCVGSECLPDEGAPVTSGLVRLSHRQWLNSVNDVLDLELGGEATAGFSDDTLGATYFDNDAERLQVASELWMDYLEAAESVARQVTATPADVEKLTTMYGADAETFVAALGRRLFRRPLASTEVTRYVEIWALGPELVTERSGDAASLTFTVQAMLQSPNFLYRDEQGAPSEADPAIFELDGWALASRLSYTLWDSTPDEELLAAAEEGELDSSAGVRAQAERLLADDRARAAILRFHHQLYQFDLYRERGGAIYEEAALRFVEDVVLEGSGGIRELLTSNVAYVNADLAGAMGLEGDFGGELERVTVDDPARSGFLTQPGFLVAKSGGTAPIHRGVFVTKRVMCVPLGAQQVFTSPTYDASASRRDQITELTGACGSTCHAPNINALGFAFEGFDDLGASRTHEEFSGLPVVTTSQYDFGNGGETEFDGAAELAQIAADSRRAHECYSRNWLEYVMGRGLQETDERLVWELGDLSRNGELDARAIVLELVSHELFRVRRAEDLEMPGSEDSMGEEE